MLHCPAQSAQGWLAAGLLIPTKPSCARRYCCYLFFQLKTHGDMFKGEESTETPSLSLSGALACLTAITLIVAVASECVVWPLQHSQACWCMLCLCGVHRLSAWLRMPHCR